MEKHHENVEFLFYPMLSALEKATVNIVSTKYRIRENPPLCKSEPGLMGYVSYKPGVFGICTRSIVSGETWPWEKSKMIKETVNHEAVHAAQGCHPRQWTLGYSLRDMRLSAQRLKGVKASCSGGCDYESRMMEHEAYWLENKPTIVNKEVRKYCL